MPPHGPNSPLTLRRCATDRPSARRGRPDGRRSCTPPRRPRCPRRSPPAAPRRPAPRPCARRPHRPGVRAVQFPDQSVVRPVVVFFEYAAQLPLHRVEFARLQRGEPERVHDEVRGQPDPAPQTARAGGFGEVGGGVIVQLSRDRGARGCTFRARAPRDSPLSVRGRQRNVSNCLQAWHRAVYRDSRGSNSDNQPSSGACALGPPVHTPRRYLPLWRRKFLAGRNFRPTDWTSRGGESR